MSMSNEQMSMSNKHMSTSNEQMKIETIPFNEIAKNLQTLVNTYKKLVIETYPGCYDKSEYGIDNISVSLDYVIIFTKDEYHSIRDIHVNNLFSENETLFYRDYQSKSKYDERMKKN